jgi:hypothetical protein
MFFPLYALPGRWHPVCIKKYVRRRAADAAKMKATMFQRLWWVVILTSAGSLSGRAAGGEDAAGKAVEVRGVPEFEVPEVVEPAEREDRYEVERGVRLPGLDPSQRATLPEDVKKLLESFKAARDRYLERQKDLLKGAKSASEADREKLREQLQELRKEFVDRQRTLREEMKRRLEELRRELPNREEIIDAAKEKAKDRRGRDGAD